MVVEDTLVANRTDNHDVREGTPLSPREGGSKLNEHPPPVVLGSHDQDGVGCQYCVEVRSGEFGRDRRKRPVVIERHIWTPTPVMGELVSRCDHSGLHRLNRLGRRNRACHIDPHLVKVSQVTDSNAERRRAG